MGNILGNSSFGKILVFMIHKIKQSSKEGLIKKLYRTQVYNCKKRNQPLPVYTREELKEYLFSLSYFHSLYEIWKTSNFNVDHVPSIDRLDNSKSYSFNNIRLLPWKKHNELGHKAMKNGEVLVGHKAIKQYCACGCFVKKYVSISEASRTLNISHKAIVRSIKNNTICKGYNFKWCNEDR